MLILLLFVLVSTTYLQADGHAAVDPCAGSLRCPPLSPDITPWNKLFWGTLKKSLYSTRVSDISNLKERIRIVVSSVYHEMSVLVLNAIVTCCFFVCVC